MRFILIPKCCGKTEHFVISVSCINTTMYHPIYCAMPSKDNFHEKCRECIIKLNQNFMRFQRDVSSGGSRKFLLGGLRGGWGKLWGGRDWLAREILTYIMCFLRPHEQRYFIRNYVLQLGSFSFFSSSCWVVVLVETGNNQETIFEKFHILMIAHLKTYVCFYFAYKTHSPSQSSLPFLNM